MLRILLKPIILIKKFNTYDGKFMMLLKRFNIFAIALSAYFKYKITQWMIKYVTIE